MIHPLPPSAFIEADAQAAAAWLQAAEALPPRDAREHYDPAAQAAIREAVRAAAPAAYDALVAEVEARLLEAPYMVVVRGLGWDAHHHVCIALNSGLGVLVAGRYLPPRSQIVHHLQVRTELPGARGKMTGAEAFHSDCATNYSPARLLSMVCARADPGGGGSTRIVTAEQVRDLIHAQRGPELLRWLEETPLPWRILDPPDGQRHSHNLAALQAFLGWRGVDPRGEGVTRRPILSGDRVLWRRDAIEQGFSLLGEAPDDATRRALDFLEEALTDPPELYDYLLRDGEFMIADNLRTLHTRTPLSEDYAASERLMLRCWVARG